MKDKVVVITGASKGIGAELARQLAAKGSKLVLAARSEKELEEVAADCKKLGASVVTVKADVTHERDCQAIIAGAMVAYGRLDALVNNAGATMWARFEDIEDMEILRRIMDVNYMGAVYCTKHALPLLKQSKGLIVGISSLAGPHGRADAHRIQRRQARDDGVLRFAADRAGGFGCRGDDDLPGIRRDRNPGERHGPGWQAHPGEPREGRRGDERRGLRAAHRHRDGTARARGGDDGARQDRVDPEVFAPSLIDRIARRAVEKGR
jgi:NAD(P)-dependent dehydrogenase (short-subunit alcohol dehydrogenase family)